MKYIVLAVAMLAMTACAELDQMAADVNNSLSQEFSGKKSTSNAKVDVSQYLTPEDAYLDKKSLEGKNEKVVGYLACMEDFCNIYQGVWENTMAAKGAKVGVIIDNMDRDARKYALKCSVGTSCYVVVGGVITDDRVRNVMITADYMKTL